MYQFGKSLSKQSAYHGDQKQYYHESHNTGGLVRHPEYFQQQTCKRLIEQGAQDNSQNKTSKAEYLLDDTLYDATYQTYQHDYDDNPIQYHDLFFLKSLLNLNLSECLNDITLLDVIV